MPAIQAASLFDELEQAIQDSSRDKRVATLRRITDLFLQSPDRLNDEQIDLFDDVLIHLVKRVETRALAELGERLAPIDRAPHAVIQNLARHDDLQVAGPVLSRSSRLSEADLIDIARTKSQGHLFAITERPQLSAPVTDVLLDRGDRAVVHSLARSSGAAFSENGYATLVRRAEGDDGLAESIGSRLDLPLRFLRELLAKATEMVRSRLLTLAPKERGEDIQKLMDAISGEVIAEAVQPRDYGAAEVTMRQLHVHGGINEETVIGFALTRRFEEMVLSLAQLSRVPREMIEELMQHPRHDGLLIACKAAQLQWNTVAAILKGRFAHGSVAAEELLKAQANYTKLSAATAQRVLRFWLVRQTVSAAS